MTLEVQLKPEVESYLRARAEAEGRPVQEIAAVVLEDGVRWQPAVSPRYEQDPAKRLQAMEEFFAMLDQEPEANLELPDEVFERKNFADRW